MTALRTGNVGFNDREQGPLWIRLDVSIILLTAGLIAMGLLVVFSATRGVVSGDDLPDTTVLQKQIIFAVVGLVGAGVVASIDYRKARAFVPIAYAAALVLLVGLFFFGSTFNNATSWYSIGGVTLQPSEFAKISLILAMAAWFSNARSAAGLRFLDVIMGLGFAGLFAVLVIQQPDYGTVMVYGAIVTGVVVVAGVKPWHAGVVVLMLGGLVAFAFSTNTIQSYQIDRFIAFADENSTERYNVDQSEIAIGNGGLTGQGLFQGTQNNNSLVPEKETDFIFSVLGEELGFVGGAALLVLFGLLLMRIWRIAHLAENDFGRLIAVGVFSMFLFQAFQSVGMNMGMMPVTGIPLPLISAGGSSMITSLLAIGLVENVHAHRLR
ncbi:MAG: FtsW/RodA/SpoVE family cell cycle protein [Acidimicrobiales bacterium]